MAFVDMRMPPGWDGLETIRRIWEVHPDMEMVICSAYSDHSWDQIQRTLGASDRLLILKKPFDKVEVQQLALALTEKWNLRRFAQLHANSLAELARHRSTEVVRAHQSKSEFLARVSEQLLSPMKRIADTTSLLAGTSITPEQRDFLKDLQGSEAQLLALLNYLVQFNTIEAGHVQLQARPYELRALCESATDSYAARARAKGLKFTLCVDGQLPARVHGYPDQIVQVLALLLENALELTEHGAITVSVAPAMTPHNAEFVIRDTGRALCPERVVTFRGSLPQVDNGFAAGRAELGMGLTLALQLIDLMVGSLEFESKPGQGTTFRFTLPTRPPARAKAA